MDLITRVKGKVAAIQKAMASTNQSISEIRETIASLKSEREAVRAAPVPLAEALPHIDTLLDRWAHAGHTAGDVERIALAAMSGQTPNVELHSPRSTLADAVA